MKREPVQRASLATGPSLHTRRERLIISFLVVLAVIRVVAMGAAFPFFNNVDEQAHFDTVVKYASGGWPTSAPQKHERSSVDAIAQYSTWEFLSVRSEIAQVYQRPVWKLPEPIFRVAHQARYDKWVDRPNHEALSPPTYYVIAAAWLWIARIATSTAIGELYAIRFLSGIIVACLIVLAYRLCTTYFKDRPELRIGVPMLLAFFPQDIFYSINMDALSPLLLLGGLVLTLRWYSSVTPAWQLGVATGLVVSLTFLNKYTNIALPLMMGVFGLVRLRDAARTGRLRSEIVNVVAMYVSAAIPLGIWIAHNYACFGDLTGTTSKTAELGMTSKPLLNRMHHPIFSLSGMLTFVSDLVRTYWRGEFYWHKLPMAHLGMDALYVFTSLIFAGVACFGLLRKRPANELAGSLLLFKVSAALVAISVAQLAWLSISFNFETSFYPSKAYPYFASGRLILGTLVPFLVLYVEGLSRLFPAKNAAKWTLAAIVGLCAVITLSEILLTIPVFQSEFNWYHL